MKKDFAYDTRKEAPRREYFSGANARVYFGDIWVDELDSLQFEINETVAPIYGFHSYVYDKIARGTRIVNGQFSINFTETGYLQIIMDRLSSKIDRGNNNLLWDNAREAMEIDTRRNTSQRNIENILSASTNDTYEDYITSLKNTFWGKPGSQSNTVSRTGAQRESDTHFFGNADTAYGDNLLKTHGFNILIDFSPSANERDFEDCLNDQSKNRSLYQTVRSIMGVQIISERQEMDISGQVLKVTYGFIARDVDGSVSELSMKHNYLNDKNKSGFEREQQLSEYQKRAQSGYYTNQDSHINNTNRQDAHISNRGVQHLR